MTCEGRTFEPGSPVAFTFNSEPIPLDDTTADSDGFATITFAVPDVAAGTHTVTGTGTSVEGEPLTVTATVTVSSGELPTTGSSSTVPLTKVGLGLVAGGGLVLLGARKRRQRVARRS
jgi:LPXTG-motif cell wall-anchored protein